VDTLLGRDFRTAIAGRDCDVDLFGAAMVIARLGGDAPDTQRAARALDLIAEDARKHAGETADPEALAHAIDFQLFTVRGFHGNRDDYNDPANSYLDQVMERRAGIPITLSLVYMEVATRLGLQCDGIGYPGHFIVRCGPPEAAMYVDPFHQGNRLDRQELLANLQTIDLGGASPESLLLAITRRQVLQRMLYNLRNTFRELRDIPRWLSTVDLLLCIEPWNAALVGERGMLHYRAGNADDALTDLERYISTTGPEAVATGARRLLDELRHRLNSEGQE
jgi:regulator of sirC expression with transglutaminase-like and TPR domain